MELSDKEYLSKIFEISVDDNIVNFLNDFYPDFLKSLRMYSTFSREKRQLSVYIGHEYLQIKDQIKRKLGIELPLKFLSLNKLEKLNQ